MAVADQFMGQPLLFIAVNSGNDPINVKQYIRANQVKWPVIVDSDRAFEDRVDVKKVSLQNIWQFRSIDSEGKIRPFDGKKMAETAKELLKDANWEVDAKLIPKSLMQAHYLVEFGSYASAADVLKEAAKSRDKAERTGAGALLKFVNQRIEQKVNKAKDAQENNDPWSAYQQFVEVGEQFRGYDLSVDLRTLLKELKAKEVVKNELAAERQYWIAEKQFLRNGWKRTLVKLKRIVDRYPDTDAAKRSQEVIDSRGNG